MPSLSTVNSVKGLLQIPIDIKVEDEAIQDSLEAVEAYLLHRFGLAVEEEEVHDYFENIQRRRKIVLSKRPVAVIGKVEGKGYGETEWIELQHELLDPQKGILILEPEGSTWPPVEVETAPMFRHREWYWDRVHVWYATTGTYKDVDKIPHDLRQITSRLAAYAYRQERTGAEKGARRGRVGYEFRDDDVPPWATGMLKRWDRPEEVSWVA